MTIPTFPGSREAFVNEERFLTRPFLKLLAGWNNTLSHLTSNAANVVTIQPANASVNAGSGSPNGVVNGNPGDLYLNTAGGAGTTLWVKESGTNTKTGWIGK